MSKNRKRHRETISQRHQRREASGRAQGKRQTAKLIALLDELKHNVIELGKVNVPPLRYPEGTSSSVIEVSSPRGNEGDEDPAINRFLATLDIDLQVRNSEAYRLRRQGGGNT